MASETVFSARFRAPTLIERNRAQTVAVTIERDGKEVAADSCTFTLFKTNGEAFTGLDDAAGTTSGGTCTSPTITAATTVDETLGKDYLLKFDVVIGGETFVFYNDAALVLARLYPTISQTDILTRHHDVNDLRDVRQPNIQDYIDDGWFELITRMYEDAVPFWRWRTPTATAKPLRHLILSIIFNDYTTLLEDDDKYEQLRDFHETKYENAYNKMRARVDLNEDNTLTGDHRPAAGIVMLTGLRRNDRLGRVRRRRRRA